MPRRLVVGIVVSTFASEAKGHGVPEVMQAIALRGGRIRKRVAAAKIFASAVTIGSGGSVGREGPMVQIGASIGSSVGQLFKTPGVHMKTMVGCGAAAGIAATFNAPIAGVLFALEIIIGDFGVMQFSPVVLSSVTATAISRYYFGDFPHFNIPEYSIVSLWEYLFYPLLGVLTGLVALSFTKILYWFEDGFDAMPIPEWIKPALGGAALGLVFAVFPPGIRRGLRAHEPGPGQRDGVPAPVRARFRENPGLLNHARLGRLGAASSRRPCFWAACPGGPSATPCTPCSRRIRPCPAHTLWWPWAGWWPGPRTRPSPPS